MSIIGIVSTVVLIILVLGMLIGLASGWKKSLAKFLIYAGTTAFSLLLTPVISTAIMGSITDGTTLKIGSFSYDFKQLAEQIINNKDMTNDLFAPNSTTTELAQALMNVAINIALFLVMFLIVLMFAFLIYGIVCAVLRSNNKKIGIKPKKKVGSRIAGTFIGLLSGVVISFTFLIPVFGVMNICNKFLNSSNSTQKASAVSNQFVVDGKNEKNQISTYGELYYTDDQKIGQIETYIEKYAKIKNEYDKSPLGSVLNGLGLSQLGANGFDYLTTVTKNDLKVSLTNEFVSMINVYNEYKETFVVNEFNYTNNENIEKLNVLIDKASKSEIVKNYLVEFLPNFATRWGDGKTFLGIACPINGEMKEIFLDLIKPFETTNNFNDISKNLKSVVGLVKVANNNNMIKKVVDEKQDPIEYLKTNKTVVSELIVQLTSTSQMQESIPYVLNDFVKLAYNKVVAGDAIFNETIPTISDWKKEADIIQNIANKSLVVYDSIKNTAKFEYALLPDIGAVIDLSRQSKLLQSPLQKLISGYLNNKVDLDQAVKDQITQAIDTNWLWKDNVNETEQFSFTSLFKVVKETAEVVENFSKIDVNNIDIGSLENVVGEIIENQEVKNTVKDLINNQVIDKVIPPDAIAGHEEELNMLKGMVGTFVDETTKETLSNDIKAGQEIVNIVVDAKKNGGELKLQGTTQEEKETAANNIISAVTSSNTIMGMLKENKENPEAPENKIKHEAQQAIKTTVSGMQGADIEVVKTAITNMKPDATNPNDNTLENQKILADIFGITLPTA